MRPRVVLSYGQNLLREQKLEKPMTVIGRDPTCDLWIDDIAVSKRHMKLEQVDGTLFVEDLQSRNGVRVNGVPVTRQAIQHLDVISIGNHKMHVFDDALLPDGQIGPESTIQSVARKAPAAPPAAAALPLQETQPSVAPGAPWQLMGLKPLGAERADVVRLDQAHTMVGPAGQGALVVRRRETLFLTRLAKGDLKVNGRDVGAASCAIGLGDRIEIGTARYEVVPVPAAES